MLVGVCATFDAGAKSKLTFKTLSSVLVNHIFVLIDVSSNYIQTQCVRWWCNYVAQMFEYTTGSEREREREFLGVRLSEEEHKSNWGVPIRSRSFARTHTQHSRRVICTGRGGGILQKAQSRY